MRDRNLSIGHYRTPLRARAREPSNFELDGARADAATSAKATASRLAHDDTASQRPDGVGQLPRAPRDRNAATRAQSSQLIDPRPRQPPTPNPVLTSHRTPNVVPVPSP